LKHYSVHVVNPVETETTKLAHHIQKDIFDIEGIKESISGLDLEFVVTDQSDVAVVPATMLSKELGLPCNDIEAVIRFSDKFKCWELANSLGIPCLRSKVAYSLEEAVKAAEKLGYPAVLKPVDSSASKGVFLVNSEDELRSFFARSLARSRNKKLILQEYAKGEWQLVVEGLCSNGKHSSVSCGLIHRSWTARQVPMLPYILWPHDPPEGLIEANNKFVENSGLKFGITHAEYVLDDGKFKLLEIGCRGGGFKISSHIVPWVSGINLYDALHRSLKGEVVSLPELVHKRSALLQFFQEHEYPTSMPEFEVPGIFEWISHVSQDFHHNPDNLRHSYLIALAENRSNLSKLVEDIKGRSPCRDIPNL